MNKLECALGYHIWHWRVMSSKFILGKAFPAIITYYIDCFCEGCNKKRWEGSSYYDRRSYHTRSEAEEAASRANLHEIAERNDKKNL